MCVLGYHIGSETAKVAMHVIGMRLTLTGSGLTMILCQAKLHGLNRETPKHKVVV
jgi:hypothetical protein